MKVLTEQEARCFLTVNSLGEELAQLVPGRSRSDVVTDIGHRYAYAKLLTDHLLTCGDAVACLDITCWGIWPSAQNMDLFYSYRRFLGEERLLREAHFHVFQASEAKELRNVLHLSLISLFDVAGASTATDFRFFASHDGYIDVSWYDNAEWRKTMQWFFA